MNYKELSKLRKEDLIAMLVQEAAPVVNSSDEAVMEVRKTINDWSREHFIVFALDNSNKIIAKKTHSIGSTTETHVYTKQLFRWLLKRSRATSLIIAHNHPAGSLAASDNDIRMRDKIKEAAKLLDYRLLDALIVTEKDSISYIK